MVPELGPSLGRLGDPPTLPAERGALDIVFEDIRVDLVSRLFDVAGAARSFAAAGDREGAIASLGRVAWLELWERSVAAAARRMADTVNERLREAAAESRLPLKRLEEFLLTVEDERAIASRLGSGGASFVSALDALEQTIPAASAAGARGRSGQEEWQSALATTARRLESSWLALAAAARTEQARWKAEIEKVRGWRRPTWPVLVATTLVLLSVTYLGLVLGGYLPVPGPLEGLAEFWWAHL
ncbi:MAG TPA: hypothetical protein VGN76_09960 [Gemmatimonadales bacterium]|jgi:hypothetical protein|nr:hypothetical protein [Gemmatimonadales bacterium]